MITLEFEIRREDVLAFSQNYHDHSAATQSVVRTAYIIFPVIMGVSAVYSFFRFSAIASVIFVIFGILWVIFYPARMRQHLLKTIEKLLKEASFEKSLGHCVLNFTEDGFSSRSPIGESSYKWNAISQVRISETHLNIFLVGPMGYPIPRSQVSDDLIREVEAFVRSKIHITEHGA